MKYFDYNMFLLLYHNLSLWRTEVQCSNAVKSLYIVIKPSCTILMGHNINIAIIMENAKMSWNHVYTIYCTFICENTEIVQFIKKMINWWIYSIKFESEWFRGILYLYTYS